MRRPILSAMLPAGLASILAAIGITLPALACLLVAVAAAQTGRRGRVVDDLPVASVLVVGASLLLGEMGAILDWRYLADTAQSRLILCIAGVGLALRAMARPRGDLGAAPVRMSAPALWIPRLPAISMAAAGLGTQLLPLARRAAWFLGGDHVRHLLFVVEEHVAGNLSYDVTAYPRAWHTLIALLWSSDTARLDSHGFLSLAGIMSTCVWFLYVMLTLATSSLAVEFSRRAHLNERLTASAGLGAGSLILWPSFVGPQMVLGFETSILAALLLCVASRELLTGWGSRRAMLIIGVCVVVMAHTWQLLAPPVAAAFVAAAIAYSIRPRSSRRHLWGVAVTVLLISLASAPGAIAVATRIGFSHATEEGTVPAMPLAVIAISVSSATFVLVRHRRDAALAVASGIVILASVSAFGVAAILQSSPKTYYPTKLLWNAVFLAIPTVCFAAVLVCRSLAVRFSNHAGLVAVVFLSPLLMIVPASLMSSVLAASGHWAMVSPGRVLDAVTTPRSSSAQVVWLAGDRTNGVITRILLDFYRVARTQERTPQPALTVAEECALLLRAAQPVVLSDAESVIVRSRYSCVPELEVLAVRPRSIADARAGK